MTTFKSKHAGSTRTLKIMGDDDNLSFFVAGTNEMGEGGRSGVVSVDPADDAAIALAVMEAAAQDTLDCEPGSANHARELAINWLMTARDRAAEEADTTKREAARNRRRDELANELADSGFEYSEICDHTQRAIDRIIDMEETR